MASKAHMRREVLKWVAALVGTGLLAGCGFRLRGEAGLPFDSAEVRAAEGSILAARLRAFLEAEGKLAPRASAQVILHLGEETRRKTILSLSGDGKVREYRLELSLALTVLDAGGEERVPPIRLRYSRDFAYSDAQLLAKEAEEAALWREMEDEVLRQILRHLSRLPRR